MESAIFSPDFAGAERPRVTIAIATFNSAAFVRAALTSALRQTIAEIEVVVVDDGSSDATVATVEEMAASDPRIRFGRTARNGGPAAARNRALECARGMWFAVLDSDDLFAADRLERLVEAADASMADIVADNLVMFGDGEADSARFFLQSGTTDRWLDLDHYLAETRMFARRGANYGFLKPMIRLDALRAARLRYDERLRIGEDDDLVVRMLLAGMRYRLMDYVGYAYRKHGASISHRLPAESAAAMVSASADIVAAAGPAHPAAALLCSRHAALQRAAAFTGMIDAMKQRRLDVALRLALSRPASLPLLRMPLGAVVARLFRRSRSNIRATADPAAKAVLGALTARVETEA